MHPYQDASLPLENRIGDLLGRLTLEEKADLCRGCSGMEAGGIDRLGIPRILMADGPQGIRFHATHTEDGRQSTAFPCGMALAAGFDVDGAREYGKALARDAKSIGVRVSLGPGFNLMRTPLNGRNFEYYGEDPFLAGKTAAGYIQGCQSEKVAATPKHLALNNQEICRTTSSSEIDERTLRELYLAAFEIATREGHPWMMMSSYNRINGQFAAECGLTQDKIVKGEWGFDGVMVSDWGGAHDTVGCALGGLDLEMGSPLNDEWFGKRLALAVRAGAVPEAVVDAKVARVLRLIFRTGLFDGAGIEGKLGSEENIAVSHRSALNGAVLLKNEKNLLPLDPAKIKRIAVLGPNADLRHHRGTLEFSGGSGAVFSEREITPLAGLRQFAARHGIEVDYLPVVRFDHDCNCPPGLFGDGGARLEYFADARAMAEGKVLLEQRDATGQLNWRSEGVAVKRDPAIPENSFALRISFTLHPESDAASDFSVAAQRGSIRLIVDGETVADTEMRSLSIAKYSFAAGKARGAKVVIEFVSDYTEGAQVNLSWREVTSQDREAALARVRAADLVVFAGGTHRLYDKEALGFGDVPGADIPDLALPADQAEWIRLAAEANPNCVVTLINGSAVSVEEWIDRVPALLEMWYPGETGGRALAEILFGEAAPAGRLPFTWARRLVDYACHGNGAYPGTRQDDPQTCYLEGQFIGYRHFDRAGIAPRFPFGYGLSYTTFAIDSAAPAVADASVVSPQVTLKVKVTNTGKAAGSEVVQLYLGAVDPVLERPLKELKGFAKRTLAPGESAEAAFTLAWRDFACWEPRSKRWLVCPGRYRLSVGRSAADIVAEYDIELKS